MRHTPNALYCGDNLDVLRNCIPDGSIDLIYLDPPFKSDQNYNLLFREKDGSKSASQILAFEDTWEWNLEAERNYAAVAEWGGKLGQIMVQFRTMLGDTDMLAYLSMMAPRLLELRRVLKATGSIYLHCDSAASHYLKLLLDAIFGPDNYRTEITWLRSRNPKGSQHKSIQWGASTDTILFYSRSADTRFYIENAKVVSDIAEIQRRFPYIDEIGRWDDGPILRSDSMGARPNLVYEYKGFTPGPAGWRVIPEKLEDIDRSGNLYWTTSNRPRRKLRPKAIESNPIGNCWIDIPPINSQAQERLGYPTQKPQALLERIIRASSNEGDVILDPFCGCGTAIEAAIKLKRHWIGIDITIQAMRVTRYERLPKLGSSVLYDVVYRPCDVTAAEAFAVEQPFEFQDWAVEKLNGVPSSHRSGDRGIDGRLYFRDGTDDLLRQILVSVKGGKLKAPFVRELQGAVARERAPMGVLITLHQPSKQMIRDAASSGFYTCPSGTYPKIQIITVKEILSDVRVDLPPIQRMEGLRKRTLAVAAASQIPLPGIAG